MKMIVATLPDIDQDQVNQALVEAGFRVTRIASTGSILRSGTSTLFIGVEDDQLEDAIQLIISNTTPGIEPGMNRGSLFVLNVEDFRRL
jgi:uncharacterized protein YaaQ